MATTDEEDIDQAHVPSGVVAQVGATTYRVVGSTAETVYGRRGATLWPVTLIVLVGVALVLDGLLWTVLGGSALALLAVWVGARA